MLFLTLIVSMMIATTFAFVPPTKHHFQFTTSPSRIPSSFSTPTLNPKQLYQPFTSLLSTSSNDSSDNNRPRRNLRNLRNALGQCAQNITTPFDPLRFRLATIKKTHPKKYAAMQLTILSAILLSVYPLVNYWMRRNYLLKVQSGALVARASFTLQEAMRMERPVQIPFSDFCEWTEACRASEASNTRRGNHKAFSNTP